MAVFLREFGVNDHTRILDDGGLAATWAGVPVKPKVVLLNMPRAAGEAFEPGFICVAGDGCNLPFADRAFDVVFSNSVIEHLGSPAAQGRFAAEAERAGKGYWIQTPNRYFPIETHLLTPLVHFLPKRWAGWAVRRFTVWALLRRPQADEKRWYLEHFMRDLHLCSESDL